MTTCKNLFVVILALMVFGSCGSDDESGDRSSGTVQIDGSGTVFPLSEAVAEEIRTAQPDIRVTVGSSGTGAGFRKFARGETDITNASRDVQPHEKEALEENEIEYIQVTVALDGIAVVVNPENDWADEITVEELRAIWEPDSEVESWSDVRDDWPDEEIELYGPNTAHGTYDFYTEAVMGESGASRTDYNAVADYNVAVQGVSAEQYAMGYFGLAYYEENRDQLKLLGIDNGDGAVEPSLETVKDGSYKPLSRSLYIYVSKSAAQRPEVQEFVDFYLDTAGSLAEEVGYVPLPDDEYEAQKKAFVEFYSSSSDETQENGN